jgi:transcriptional regulator with XRE-family HTH domain
MYGNKIRMIRIARGLNQDDVAHKLGIAQTAYSKIETNHQKVTEEQINALAKIFGVSPEDLTSIEPIIMNFMHHSNNNGGFNVTNTFNQNQELVKQLSQELSEKNNQIQKLLEIINKSTT